LLNCWRRVSAARRIAAIIRRTSLVLQADDVGVGAEDGQRMAVDASGKRRAGCSFSHPRLTISGALPDSVQSDVAQRADGDGGAGRVDG